MSDILGGSAGGAVAGTITRSLGVPYGLAVGGASRARNEDVDGIQLSNASDGSYHFSVPVPDDYSGGDITVTLAIWSAYSGLAGETARIQLRHAWPRVGVQHQAAGFATVSADIPLESVVNDTPISHTYVIPAAAVQRSAVVLALQVARVTGVVAVEHAHNLYVLGVTMSYAGWGLATP